MRKAGPSCLAPCLLRHDAGGEALANATCERHLEGQDVLILCRQLAEGVHDELADALGHEGQAHLRDHRVALRQGAQGELALGPQHLEIGLHDLGLCLRDDALDEQEAPEEAVQDRQRELRDKLFTAREGRRLRRRSTSTRPSG